MMREKDLPEIEGTEHEPKVNDRVTKTGDDLSTRRTFTIDRRVKIGTTIGLPLVLLSGLVTAAVLQPSSEQPPPPIEVVTSPPTAKVTNNEINFWQVNGGTKYPVELEKWQTQPYSEANKAVYTKMREKYAHTELATSASLLPSAKAGWVSDPKSEFLKDGTPNPRFTPVTDEVYLNSVESYIERLINPVFGEWKQYQYSDGEASKYFDESRFSDMFAREYLKKNFKNSAEQYIPVYADWKQNDYGIPELLDEGPRWIGTADSVKTEMRLDKKTGSYKSKVIVDVSYVAWAEDQSTLTRKGVLTLDIVTKSTTDTAPVQIENAKLDLK